MDVDKLTIELDIEPDPIAAIPSGITGRKKVEGGNRGGYPCGSLISRTKEDLRDQRRERKIESRCRYTGKDSEMLQNPLDEQ